jgi:hypothetical protein
MFLEPPPTVSERQLEVAETDGWKVPVKLASPTIASTVAVGTPLVQLAAVAHAVLEVPRQLVVWLLAAKAISVKKKAQSNLVTEILGEVIVLGCCSYTFRAPPGNKVSGSVGTNY